MTAAARPAAAAPPAASPGTRVVRDFIEAFRGDRLDQFGDLLTDGCVDKNRGPLQGPGRAGVMLKMALFRALHPGTRLCTTLLRDREDGWVEARWTTTFADGARTDWLGHFLVEDCDRGRIGRFEVWRVG